MDGLPFGITPQHLNRCRELAAQAAAAGNSPVGCLAIRDGEVLAGAAEAAKSQADITCHAELLAIRQARNLLGTPTLSDCILLSTHEPCVMCGYAIRFHGIRAVVYAQPVAFLGSVSSSFDILTSAEVPGHWAPPPEVLRLEF